MLSFLNPRLMRTTKMSDANCPHCGTPHRCCGTKIVRLSCRVPNKTIQTPLCLEREAHNKTKHERDEAITALDKMSKYLAQFTGSCPYECFDIEPHSDPCSEICDKFTNETNLCWKQHFMKEIEK